MGGRVVYCGGLENRSGREPTGGSNPSPSVPAPTRISGIPHFPAFSRVSYGSLLTFTATDCTGFCSALHRAARLSPLEGCVGLTPALAESAGPSSADSAFGRSSACSQPGRDNVDREPLRQAPFPGDARRLWNRRGHGSKPARLMIFSNWVPQIAVPPAVRTHRALPSIARPTYTAPTAVPGQGLLQEGPQLGEQRD